MFIDKYIPSDFAEETCSIGTLSRESSSVSREYLNSVFVGLKVRLLDKSRLFSFSRLGDKTRLN